MSGSPHGVRGVVYGFVAAAEERHREMLAAVLTLASVGTFLSVGLKLPFFTFGGSSRGLTVTPAAR